MRKHSENHKTLASDVIFSASVTGSGGSFFEVVVTADYDVYCNSRPDGRQQASVVLVDRRPRDVERFLQRIETLDVANWGPAYGSGSPADAGGWMVLLEIDRRVRKWQGCGQYPPNWDEFCQIVGEMIHAPFG